MKASVVQAPNGRRKRGNGEGEVVCVDSRTNRSRRCRKLAEGAHVEKHPACWLGCCRLTDSKTAASYQGTSPRTVQTAGQARPTGPQSAGPWVLCSTQGQILRGTATRWSACRGGGLAPSEPGHQLKELSQLRNTTMVFTHLTTVTCETGHTCDAPRPAEPGSILHKPTISRALRNAVHCPVRHGPPWETFQNPLRTEHRGPSQL